MVSGLVARHDKIEGIQNSGTDGGMRNILIKRQPWGGFDGRHLAQAVRRPQLAYQNFKISIDFPTI